MTTATAVPTKFSEIIVATDFGEEADRALAYAKAIARGQNSELLLVHVAPPPTPIAVPEGGWIDDSSFFERAQNATEAAGITLREDGFKARALCCFGTVADEVAREARENRANLVVAGTHGRQGLGRLFFGSHAESMAGQMEVPVFIVGPKCPPPSQQQWSPNSVLCSVSMNLEGAQVAAFACRLAAEYGASLAVAYQDVSTGRNAYDDWLDLKRAILSMLPHEQRNNIAIHPLSLTIPDADALVELAIARDTDLLIIGVHHRLFDWPSLGAGRLPRLIAEAPCPVMTVPVEKVH